MIPKNVTAPPFLGGELKTRDLLCALAESSSAAGIYAIFNIDFAGSFELKVMVSYP